MINFLLTECTFLRYFIPLIDEANKRGIASTVFVGSSGKYNCPQLKENQEIIIGLSKEFGFSLRRIEEASTVSGEVFFCIEGCGFSSEDLKQRNKVYSMTYMTDYTGSYENYINRVDNVIFPSLKFAEYYDKISDKNLYLGSPKYSTKVDNDSTYQKYDLNKKDKTVLIIAPRLRDIGKINLNTLYGWLKSMGYVVLVKARGKDPLPQDARGDYYFEDVSWYPHTTMELIGISDFVINFSSTVIKECVIMKKPFINFHIKPHKEPRAYFLYEYSYCQHLKPSCTFEEFKDSVYTLVNSNFDDDFKISIRDNLFIAENVCGDILDHTKG